MKLSLGPARGFRALALMLAAASTPLACSDATDVELLEIRGSGVIVGRAFLDLDGDALFSGADSAVQDTRVRLVTNTTGELVLEATTDSAGVFALVDVPVGEYRLQLDSAVVADSLETIGAGGTVAVSLDDTLAIDLGVTYPTLTVEEVLVGTPGQRVFTSGITLNARLNFDPLGQVHIAGATGFLRALSVDRVNISTGDSVRFLGRIATDNGRPALADVTPTILVTAAANPIPAEVTVAQASTADGGGLDAALVRIRQVEITDTSRTVDGDFRFWGVVGSDSVEIVLREFLGLNTAVIRPDTTVRLAQAAGLLTPFDGGGTVRWRLLPRGGSDLTLETKTADIRISAGLAPTSAALGDTVEVTVVALNAGPLRATGVAVRDTVPTAMGFVSATETRGSYDPVPGTWSIGDMDAGSADTLRLRLQLTDTIGIIQIPIVSESLGLTFEVDPNILNSRAVVILTVS